MFSLADLIHEHNSCHEPPAGDGIAANHLRECGGLGGRHKRHHKVVASLLLELLRQYCTFVLLVERALSKPSFCVSICTFILLVESALSKPIEYLEAVEDGEVAEHEVDGFGFRV